MRTVTLYIAMSLDGYIAALGDNLGFLDKVEKTGEDYGYGNFITEIDTIILGRRTYDWLMQHVSEYPHTDNDTYIIISNPKESIDNIQFYTGDLTELINGLKKKKGKGIFVDGGSELVNALLKQNLIEEFIISIIPVFLGAGTPLFREGRPQADLTLVDTKRFDTGLVQLHYKRFVQ